MNVNNAYNIPAGTTGVFSHNATLADAKERREMRTELHQIRELMKSWGYEDTVTQKISFWLDGFTAALHLDNNAKEIIDKYLHQLLEKVLIDSFTSAVLTEDMVLGSDQFTYNPHTLIEFQKAFENELVHLKNRSPLDINNEAPLTIQPHFFGIYVLRWVNQKLGIVPEAADRPSGSGRQYYGDVIIEDAPEEEVDYGYFHPDDIRIRNADDPESDRSDNFDINNETDNDYDSDSDAEFEEELRLRRAARERQNARISELDAVNQLFEAEHDRIHSEFTVHLEEDRQDWRRYTETALAHLRQMRSQGLEEAAVVERAIAQTEEGIQNYARENTELDRRNAVLRTNLCRNEANTNQLQINVNEAEKRMNESNGKALQNVAMTIGIVIASVCASYALAQILQAAATTSGAEAGLAATKGGGMLSFSWAF